MHQNSSQSVSFLIHDDFPPSLMVISSWFERLTMTVILINCVTLGMYKPCADTNHCNRKCLFLTVEDLEISFPSRV